MKLVLFDLDGTLTKKDTMWSFLHFHAGGLRFIFNVLLLSPVLALYVLRIVSAEKAKRITLKRFLKGQTQNELNAAGEKFCAEKMSGLMNEELVKKLNVYRNDGYEVCIVTASCEEWVKPFCTKLNAALIATELKYDDAGIFRGEFRTPNCKGAEKVNRIRAKYRTENYADIVAYGNAPEDIPMMKLAHTSFTI